MKATKSKTKRAAEAMWRATDDYKWHLRAALVRLGVACGVTEQTCVRLLQKMRKRGHLSVEMRWDKYERTSFAWHRRTRAGTPLQRAIEANPAASLDAQMLLLFRHQRRVESITQLRSQLRELGVRASNAAIEEAVNELIKQGLVETLPGARRAIVMTYVEPGDG